MRKTLLALPALAAAVVAVTSDAHAGTYAVIEEEMPKATVVSPPPVLSLTAQARVDYAVTHGKKASLSGLIVGYVTASESKVLYYAMTTGATKPDAGTAYRIGSITKTFTGTLLSLFASRGYVKIPACAPFGGTASTTGATKVQAELDAIAPGTYTLPIARAPMTLEDLATHYGGLPKNSTEAARKTADLYTALTHRIPNATTNALPGDTSDYTQDFAPGLCPDGDVYNTQVMPKCGLDRAIVPAAHAPNTDSGTTFKYSNWGYAVLGHLLVHHDPGYVQGTSTWRSVTRDRILAPLGMNGTFADPDPEPAGVHKAKGWYGCTTSGCATSTTSPLTTTLNPMGGLWSTGPDMLKYLRYVMDVPQGTGAPSVTQTELYGKVRDDAQCRRHDGIGLGWARSSLAATGSTASYTLVSKDGAWTGFRAYLGYLPARGVGVFVLANGDAEPGGGTDVLAKQILLALAI
jgi:CubicO group peptidase (beta-lactamase class C family)